MATGPEDTCTSGSGTSLVRVSNAYPSGDEDAHKLVDRLLVINEALDELEGWTE